MKTQKLLLLTGFALMSVIICGCGPSYDPADINAFTKPHEVFVNMDNYVVQPPDELKIICSKVPEIHEAVQNVRPDGKISFEALGEMDVAGKTIAEVAAMIKEKAMTLYALAGDYPVDVQVSAFASKYYYVAGQVNFPGPKLVTGRDTALSALLLAQPNVLSWDEKIRVIRPSRDPEVPAKIFEFDLQSVYDNGDVSQDVLLEEGDIVYARPTVLAAIAMVVEEFVRPIGRAFSTVNIVQGP